MTRFGNFLVAMALLVLVVLAAGAGAQQQKSPPVKAGVVSGSVFLITKSGDLKPARMAVVYLLYKYRSVKWANAHPEDEDSAGQFWMTSHIKLKDEYVKVLSVEGSSCPKSLLTYLNALPQAQEWASEKHKAWQIISTETDENGAFKITVPRPGRYLILAAGHAGFNNAFWEVDKVDVSPGTTTTVKVSSPAESCLTE